MTFRDLVTTASGNLWRMKLRSTLTMSGIIIAIAAFVAMLSFGAGMQLNIAEQFDKLGLLSIIQVYPNDDEKTDTTLSMQLDDAALDYLNDIHGVKLVYPYESLELTASLGDSVQTVSAQALSFGAVRTKLFSNLSAGTLFSSDSTKEALISEDMLKAFGFESADSIVDKRVVISIEVARVDSGITAMLQPLPEIIRRRTRGARSDSIRIGAYADRIVREELSGALKRFTDGFMNNRETMSDTLTVCGVLESRRGGRLRLNDMIIPVSTVRTFSSSGFSGNPVEILTAIQSGRLFVTTPDSLPASYAQVTVVMDAGALYEPIRDSISAAGFRTFSFAEQFDEIRRFFRYFNLGLGLVGLIALMTASLGIINTMVMSITERRREIGVWMSLGADVWDIRRLYLVESGLIGLLGALGGLTLGWLISRVGSLIARTLMATDGITPMELFHVPLWLALTALIFGVLVSLAAGYYPASRAARIDPVAALRDE
jgi:putative ABC transport system permease protein